MRIKREDKDTVFVEIRYIDRNNQRHMILKHYTYEEYPLYSPVYEILCTYFTNDAFSISKRNNETYTEILQSVFDLDEMEFTAKQFCNIIHKKLMIIPHDAKDITSVIVKGKKSDGRTYRVTPSCHNPNRVTRALTDAFLQLFVMEMIEMTKSDMEHEGENYHHRDERNNVMNLTEVDTSDRIGIKRWKRLK